MLTEIELETVGYFVGLCDAALCFPFTWNVAERTISVFGAKFKTAGLVLNGVVTCLYSLFQIYRLYELLSIGVFPKVSKLAVHCVFIVGNICTAVFQLAIFVDRYQFAELFNQLIRFNFIQGQIQYKTGFGNSNFRAKIFRFMFWWLVTIGFLMWGIFPLMSSAPCFLFSILPPQWQRSTAVWLCSVLFEGFIAFKLAVAHGGVVQFIYVYIVTSKFWLNLICVEWPQRPTEPLTHYRRLFILYRTCDILNSMYNQTVSRVVIPTFKGAIMFCCILLLYGSLALARRMSLSSYVFFPVCGVFLLLELMAAISIMAQFYYYSESLQRNFSYTQIVTLKELREIKGTIRSCRAIRCDIGGLYFVDRSCQLIVVSFLVNSVINLLITL